MIKEKSQLWFRASNKIGKLFTSLLPFSPAFYTVLSLIMASLAIMFASFHMYITTILLFCLAAFCDIVDGAVARAQNKASHLGAFIDGVTDRFVDFAILFSYFFFDIQTIFLNLGQWISIASFVVILPSFNVAYANHRKAVKDDNETLIWRLMNRGEMFVMMLGVLIISLFNSSYAGFMLIALIALSTVTIIQTIATTIYHSKKITSSLHDSN